MPTSTASSEFDAKDLLKRSLQTTGLYDTQEFFLVCRLFRLPFPDTNDEQVCMPGAYITLPIPEFRSPHDHITPHSMIRRGVSRQPGIIQRVFKSLFSLEKSSVADRIPQDVLKRIFVLAHANKFLLHGPLTLINVSKQWRTIALTVPLLWNELDITYENFANPFYTLLYHICHAEDLRVYVNSPVALTAFTTLNAVIPITVRPKIRLVQLSNLTLLGLGAIEAIDSFQFHYPSLTRLTLMEVRHLFPINLLSNCPALEILTIDFSIEVIHEKFLNEDLPNCVIVCNLLEIIWSAKWVHFHSYGNNLSILHFETFVYSLADSNVNGSPNDLPYDLLSKNLDIQNLILRGVSFAHMDFEAIATSEDPGLYPPLTDLSRLTRLQLSDVDQATVIFQLCIKFPTIYFPQLISLYLSHVTLDVDVLMSYIHMKTGGSGPIPLHVSRLRTLYLESIPFSEEYLAELRLIATLEEFILETS